MLSKSAPSIASRQDPFRCIASPDTHLRALATGFLPLLRSKLQYAAAVSAVCMHDVGRAHSVNKEHLRIRV